MKPFIQCPVCFSKNVAFSFKNHDRITAVKGVFEVWRCSLCTAFFVNPRPSQKKLSKFYANHYYTNAMENKNNPVRRFERWYLKNIAVKKGVFSILAREILNPPLSFFKVIKKRRFPFIKNGTLLDIGCGSGEFLEKMQSLGMNVTGVDPFASKEAGINAKITIHRMPLEKAPLKPESFDVITMNHVLEHVPNPHIVFSTIHKLLKEEGIFVFAVPDSSSLSAKVFKQFWLHWDTPRHLIMYNIHSLQVLAQKNDFKIISVKHIREVSSVNATFLNYYQEHKIPNFIKNFAKKRLSALIPLIPYTIFTQLFNSGEHLELILKKNILKKKADKKYD